MRVTVERAALVKALGHVHRVVERRTTIPILSNVLLKADGGGLRLKATDLDLEVIETIAAEVGQPGGTTVPAHTLHDIVRKLPDGAQVSLETSGDAGQMQLRSGRSRFTLQALPESDFPDLAAGELSHRFAIPADVLRRLIGKTQFAISQEETRYYLNGIFAHTIDVEGTTMLRMVATDGHRLARVGVDLRAHVFATRWSIVARELPRVLAQARPDAVLHLGVAARRRSLCVETVARSTPSMIAPDAGGRSAPSEKRASAHAALRIAVSPAPLLASLRNAGAGGRLSNDAGRYLCNALYHQSLALRADAREARPTLFIHTPMPGARTSTPTTRIRTRKPGATATLRGLENALLALARAARLQRAT